MSSALTVSQSNSTASSRSATTWYTVDSLRTSRSAISRDVKPSARRREPRAPDASEDEQFGNERGDELPVGLRDRRSRIERLRRCREQLEAEQAQLQADHEANLRWRAEWEAEHGRKLGGRKPTPPDPDALAKRTINTTDPDSRKMRRAGGRSVQGFNAQIVTNTEQVILAANITQAANDSSQLAPMIAQAIDELAHVCVDQPIGTVLADGGY